jgi:hypothetical protein
LRTKCPEGVSRLGQLRATFCGVLRHLMNRKEKKRMIRVGNVAHAENQIAALKNSSSGRSKSDQIDTWARFKAY